MDDGAVYRALYPVNGFVKVGDELRLHTDSGMYAVPDDVRAVVEANFDDPRVAEWARRAGRYADDLWASGADEISLPGLAA